MKWFIICLTCGAVIDSMENGPMAEAVARHHATENVNHDTYVAFKA